MKKLVAVFLLGFCSPVLLALYAGGENLAQLGLRLHSFERGIATAMTHHSFVAAVDADVERLAQVETEPKKGRGKR